MTREGSTENESRYRNLNESILRERLLFRNPGRFGPRNKTFRHQDISCSKSEIRHTYTNLNGSKHANNTNLNGSKHANIVHVIEKHVFYPIHPSSVEIFWCRKVLVRVPFVNCRQFMYLVISLLVLRAGCGI